MWNGGILYTGMTGSIAVKCSISRQQTRIFQMMRFVEVRDTEIFR